MRAYLATPLFTPHQRLVLHQMKELLEELGFELFSPLHESQAIWAGRAPAQCTSEERKAVVEQNAVNVGTSDLVVAWIGGWNPSGAVIDQVLSRIAHDKGVIADDPDITAAVRRLSPSLPDVGVTWELGYANASGTPVLAYLDDTDEDRTFNLMISETCSGMARGMQQLRDQLEEFLSTGKVVPGFLESEPEEIPA